MSPSDNNAYRLLLNTHDTGGSVSGKVQEAWNQRVNLALRDLSSQDFREKELNALIREYGPRLRLMLVGTTDESAYEGEGANTRATEEPWFVLGEGENRYSARTLVERVGNTRTHLVLEVASPTGVRSAYTSPQLSDSLIHSVKSALPRHITVSGPKFLDKHLSDLASTGTWYS